MVVLVYQGHAVPHYAVPEVGGGGVWGVPPQYLHIYLYFLG